MDIDDDTSGPAVDALAPLRPYCVNDLVDLANPGLVLSEYEHQRLPSDGSVDVVKSNGLLFIASRTDEPVADAVGRRPHGPSTHLSLFVSAAATTCH